MQPEDIANGSESSEQIALLCWCNLKDTKDKYPLLKWLFHIPNGEQRSAMTGAKLKALGVKPGVPDLLLLIPCNTYHGLVIELKRPNSFGKKAGQPSPEQMEWLTFLSSQGYRVKVCYGWESARDMVIEYMEG